MNAGSAVSGQTARDAARSGPVQMLGRIGLVAYGVVHLLIASLALQVAIGDHGEKSDKSGALHTVAEQPGGKFMLWVIAVGLVALTLWQLVEAIWGHRTAPARKRTEKRLLSGGKAVIFGALGFSAYKIAAGDHGSSDQGQTFTAKVLAWPFGQLLVGLVGLAIIGIAAYVVVYGFKKKFLEELDFGTASATTRKIVTRLGQVGYPGLGVAYGSIGVLVVWAAVTFDAEKAQGLDGALKTLASQPYGPFLLGIVALGLACYGAHCIAAARFHKV
jgi:hypothetical protein